MHVRWIPLLLLAVGCAACSEESVGQTFPAPDVIDDVARIDAGPEVDVAPDFVAPDRPAACYGNNAFCPMGQVCIGEYCAPDPCASVENTCGADRCLARCVPLRDPCAGVRCAERETCVEGRCNPGCYPSLCAGVMCPTGQFCARSSGQCEPIQPCSPQCPAGAACHIQCVPPAPCDGVTCAEEEFCAEGRCVANPCARVRCDNGQTCVNGACVETCTCPGPCTRGANDRCVFGMCVCAPRCDLLGGNTFCNNFFAGTRCNPMTGECAR